MNTLGKVLVLGAGALKIGQSGEFDYSGSQALKALREEGIATILVNPNIATIQTSRLLADQVYFLPVTPFFVEKIIEKERPDGILLSFGGQTALNCGIELFHQGILEKYKVQILGTPISAIILTEDRHEFAQHLQGIDIPIPQSKSAETLDEAIRVGTEIGFPLMVRAGFALGGQGSGIAGNVEELERIVSGALAFAPQVLIEQYLHHYKEVEYEVVRDAYDNCITVCNMENMDPLGIHTGESIVVAPSQTLTNAEYHTLRTAATAIVRSLGVIGECNVQFALNPKTSAYYVIEVNARLSRSSALASKATGYPLAYVAAKLALGYGLTDLTNQVTGVTQACFEPSLDYVVVRMLDLDFEGVTSDKVFAGSETAGDIDDTDDIISKYLYTPTPKREFALSLAMRNNISIEKIAAITGIDPWFLQRMKHIVDIEQALLTSQNLSASCLLALKQAGISDKRIGELTGKSGLDIRALRKKLGITPSVFQIDTLAAEFPSDTNYLYMTYNGQHHDVLPLGNEGVIVLGSGPYRIGSSVEFDWTSVSTVQALKKYHKRSVVINCNPETVSTDYDISDRLYFEELTFERIADICEFESSGGVIVAVGGQTPNNRAKALQRYGIPILGTNVTHIDQAEDRSKFSRLLDTLDIHQPPWATFTSVAELINFAERVNYPVLVRPSYVLSGDAMHVCYTQEELEQYTREAAAVSPEHPITVSKFFQKVKEIELDAVAQNGEIKAFVIAEHIENAGVHSGDATIVLPPQTLNVETTGKIEEAGRAVARALAITGPFNIQFLAKDNQVYVIEANLRASRTFPFICKVTGVNFIELFVDALFAEKELPLVPIPPLSFTAVKAPQFSFSRLSGADPLLGVEMASTGEVACFGEDLEEAYLKAILATGGSIPKKGIFISLGGEDKKAKFLESARQLSILGIPLYATEKTSAFLWAHDIEVTMLYKIHERRSPNVLTYFRDNKIDLAINIVDRHVKKEVDDDYAMRRYAVDHNIPLFTKIKQARLFIKAIVEKDLNTIPIKAWNEY
ncbi:MAG: carbamoyl-phosphate synthase large subunit [Chloroflexi bacterium]|nr:MAG: carbamoyl-phosphate synthase large subunit [Chloroflexota bacterium]